MENKMNRNFNEWLAKFKRSIAGYDYYVDFKKVYKNVASLKIELNILNSLIGSMDIENGFYTLLKTYPTVLRAIPLLLAIREKEIFIIDGVKTSIFNFEKMNYSEEEYGTFMKKSGLFDLLQNHIINNLYDYALGIEVGLDSNGRKGRGGDLMEDIVEKFINEAAFEKGIDYFKEMTLRDIEIKWNTNLSAMSADDTSTKRFDFVIKKPSMIYLVETNFYTSNGSKLHETARSYKSLALSSKQCEGVAFVWITDGKGWNSARNNLKETFDVMEHIYNINDLENGAIKKLL